MATLEAGVPQWKADLLQKKKRQEDSKRRMSEEDHYLSNMPEWKRNILRKKHENSRLFLTSENGNMQHPELIRRDSGSSMESPRSVASNSSSDVMLNHSLTNDEDVGSATVEPEHLLPVLQNPWMVTDPGRYRVSKGSLSPRSASNISSAGPAYEKQLSHLSDSDDVFQITEEQLEYGPGVVKKLKQRFTTLTSNDEYYYPKRSHSADNLLDEGVRRNTLPRSHSTTDHSGFISPSQYPCRHSYSTLPAPTKTYSVDDLNNDGGIIRTQLPNGDCIDGANSSDTYYNTDSGSSPCMSPRSVDSTCDNIILNELPRPNTVSSKRSIFESVSSKTNTLFSSLRKSKSHDVGLASGASSSVHNHCTLSPVTPVRASSPQIVINGDIGHDSTDSLNTGTGVISHSKSEDNVLHVNNETGSGVAKIHSTEESIKNIRQHGRSWYFNDKGSTEVKINRFSSDSNSNESHGSSNESLTYSSSVTSDTYSSTKHNNEINNRINASDRSSYKTDSSTLYNGTSNHIHTNGDYIPNTDHHLQMHLTKLNTPSTDHYDHVSIGLDASDTNSASVHHGLHNGSKQSHDISSTHFNNTSSVKAVRPSSLPHNQREEVPREGNVSSKDKVVSKYTTKPPSTSVSSRSNGPGSLTIRPASNVILASSVPYVDMKGYEDVHTGVFKPARKTGRTKIYMASGCDDVPVTNIDDIPDDVPVTFIDDVSPSKSPLRSEMDADRQRKATSSQYEFTGAGVTFGKSLLMKSGRGKKVSLNNLEAF